MGGLQNIKLIKKMKILHWILAVILGVLFIICMVLSVKYQLIDNLRYWTVFNKMWHISILTLLLAAYFRIWGYKYL
jgi:hypothetical protein